MLGSLWGMQDSFGILSRSLLLMTFTKRNMSRSFYRSFVFLRSPPSVSGLSEAQYTNLSPSSSPHRQLLVKYLTTDSSSLELKEESYAKKIRRAILKVCDATVEDVVQSLRSDQSCCSIQLTPNLVDSLLHRFGDDWKSALGFFKWAGSQSGYKHTLYACDRMVDLLGKMKQTDRMWDLVHELRSEGLVTLETVAKIMRRLAGAGRWKDTVKLFDDLETMGFDKDTRSMNILLDTLCKEKRVEVAREAFSVLKSHIPPDAFTFNIFVHGWCGARRIDEAMWTIEEMKKWGLRPSVITYSTILQAYCNQHKFQEVYDLLDRMVVEGCLPNVVTYTTIMNSLANSGKLEEALGVVKRMKSSGCELDILFYNSLINILGKAGRLREAAHIFDIDMQRNGIRRNLSTYNTMISIFCHNCQEQNALNVLKEMENLSCKPDLQTYRPLLKLCFKLRQQDDHIHSLFSDMINKHHLSLDLDTYTLLIHGLCSIGNIEWACLLFDEMIGREIQPRHRTCELLMDEATQKNMEAAVERIKTVMKQVDHTP